MVTHLASILLHGTQILLSLQTTSLKRWKPQPLWTRITLKQKRKQFLLTVRLSSLPVSSPFRSLRLSLQPFRLTLPLLMQMTRHVTSATATPVLSLVLRAALAVTYMTAIHQRAKRLFVASSPSSGAVVATPPSSGLK